MVLIFAALLFFLPLLVFPFTPFAFETPKVVISQIGIEVLFLLSLLSSKGLNIKKLNPKLLIPSLILFLLGLIHIMVYPSEANLFGNIFRLQGIFLFWHLILFGIVSSIVDLSKISKNIYLIPFLGVFLGTLILGENVAGRRVGTLGEPNALGITAVILFAYVFLNFRNVYARAIFLLITLGIVLLSKSISALIGLAIVLIFLLLLRSKQVKFRTSVIACLVLIGGTLLLPFSGFSKSYQTVSPASSPFKFESRAEIWQTAFVAGFKSPIIGSGFGNLQITLRDTSKQLNNIVQYQIVDSSHNFLLDYWVQGGIVALLSIASLIFFAIKGFIKEKNTLKVAVFLVVLIGMLFNPVSVVTLLFFWWLIGQGFLKEDL